MLNGIYYIVNVFSEMLFCRVRRDEDFNLKATLLDHTHRHLSRDKCNFQFPITNF